MSFSILGTGKAVPDYILTNDELATIVETNDEWIRTRTGIEERRICKDETITELCVKAAKEALDDAGITAEQLDLIICSTMRGENLTPSQGCMIQRKLVQNALLSTLMPLAQALSMLLMLQMAIL